MEDKISHQLSVKDLFRLSLRIFKTKPARTFLTILGMSVGIGTVIFLVSLGYGLQFILIGKLVTTEDSLITLGASYPTESGLNINSQKIEEINKIAEVGEISAIAEFPAEIKNNEITGLVIAKIVDYDYFRLSGTVADIGNSFKNKEFGVVLSNQAGKLINLNPDNSSIEKEIDIKIFYQSDQASSEDPDYNKNLLVKGIINDDQEAPFIIIPIDSTSKQPPFFKELLIKAVNIESVEKLKDKLIEQGFLISARIDLVNQAKKVMNIITIILGVFGITALVVSAIGMFNTMIVSFLERIYEVGIMKSLGATDPDIKKLFLMESFVMGFLGGAGGIIIGGLGGKGINLLLSVFAQHFGGKPFTLFITPLWFAGLTLFLSAMIGVISGFWPAHRTSYLSPKEAFKNK